MKSSLMIAVMFTAGCVGFAAVAQEAETEEVQPASENLETELDEFRNGLFTMFNEGNYEQMLNDYCDEDIITMWQDGTMSRGYAGVLAEFERLSQIIDKIQVNPTVEERLVLDDGTTVISSGKMGDTYELKRGETVALNSLWTATMVKQGERWRLVSFSGTANAFDNEVIRLYFGEASNRFAAITALIGFAVGAVLAAFFFKRRSPAASP